MAVVRFPRNGWPIMGPGERKNENKSSSQWSDRLIKQVVTPVFGTNQENVYLLRITIVLSQESKQLFKPCLA